ncbi:T-cell surface glycoprotein CD8 alpha chain isoform X2 [Colossoma macropomum]|uniref:T-cell surface glycoprotein CD8 alpha chain isoform X2 n=1 Tax=Colossoma macropomum TaxID=42526 RepID=UPI0018655D19|nr:T-cell surface glycoprotein CD8 alpha chain isoform X2 [Colossoma macropomum]
MFGLPTGPLLLLFLFHGACSETMKEGEDKDIPCDPKSSGTVWWFRLINNAQLEFIASFSSSGDKKVGDLGSKFDHQKMKSSKILTLKGFKKETDSGSYSCATINNNKLLFGSVTSLRGTPDPKPETTVVPTTRATPEHFTTKSTESWTTLGCELVILISLAAGNGLLLILLIITILYCNRMRTRQCPHHYKRDSQSKPAGHRPLSHQTEL